MTSSGESSGQRWTWTCHLCNGVFHSAQARSVGLIAFVDTTLLVYCCIVLHNFLRCAHISAFVVSTWQCHMANVWKNDADPTRCDKKMPAAAVPFVPARALVTAPAGNTLVCLARRKSLTVATEVVCRCSYKIVPSSAVQSHGPRRLTGLQDLWDGLLTSTKQLGSDKFWQIFLPLHQFSAKAIDSALRAIKQTFLSGATREEKNCFRSVAAAFSKKLGDYPPSGRSSCTATVYVWVNFVANCPATLHQSRSNSWTPYGDG